jgi:membrane associated rhomboid family serine protease
VWVFQASNDLTVGASGLIFGYFGYVLVRGFFDRNFADIGVGLVAGALYWTILQVALPGTPGVSWIGHLGGLVGGILAAWLLRTPAAAALWAPRQRRAPASPHGGKSVDDLLRELKEQTF